VVQFSFSFVPQVHIGSGSNEGRLAVTAGPLVLALDQADNPDVRIPQYVARTGLTTEKLAFESQPAPGQRFTVSFDSMDAVAIRIVGKPASGGNPAQAFVLCAGISQQLSLS
jgi:hypothetical protein